MERDKKSVATFKNVSIANSRGQKVFERLNFQIYEGERLFILGHTDRERSLILYTLLGLSSPLKGEVRALKRKINSLSALAMLEYRRYTGYVYAQEGLLEDLTLAENIELPLLFSSELSEEKIRERLLHIFELFDLDRELLEGSWAVNNIVKKKVLLARAVINSPRLLLIDEPTTYIENSDRAEIKRLIDEVIGDEFLLPESTIVITSEDKAWAKEAGDRIIYIEDGRIEYCGPACDFKS